MLDAKVGEHGRAVLWSRRAITTATVYAKGYRTNTIVFAPTSDPRKFRGAVALVRNE